MTKITLEYLNELREKAKEAKIELCYELINSLNNWRDICSQMEFKLEKLLEFVRQISCVEQMNHTQEEPATQLLREIGELDDKT